MASVLELVNQKRKALQEQSGRRQRATSLKPGDNIVRLLPSWKGEGEKFWHDFGMHFIKRPGRDKVDAAYVCVNRTFDRPCPICDMVTDGISRATSDEQIQNIRSARAAHRMLFNAIIQGGEADPVVLETPASVAEQVFDLMGTYGDITALADGIQLKVTRSGQGLNTRYTVIPMPGTNPLQADVLTKLHDLDQYVSQEYEEGERKALAAMSNVVGSLPAPAKPITRQAPMEYDDDLPLDGGTLESSEGAVTIDAEPEVTLKSQTSPAESAPEVEKLSGDELDALLNELDDEAA